MALPLSLARPGLSSKRQTPKKSAPAAREDIRLGDVIVEAGRARGAGLGSGLSRVGDGLGMVGLGIATGSVSIALAMLFGPK